MNGLTDKQKEIMDNAMAAINRVYAREEQAPIEILREVVCLRAELAKTKQAFIKEERYEACADILKLEEKHLIFIPVE